MHDWSEILFVLSAIYQNLTPHEHTSITDICDLVLTLVKNITPLIDVMFIFALHFLYQHGLPVEDQMAPTRAWN